MGDEKFKTLGSIHTLGKINIDAGRPWEALEPVCTSPKFSFLCNDMAEPSDVLGE